VPDATGCATRGKARPSPRSMGDWRFLSALLLAELNSHGMEQNSWRRENAPRLRDRECTSRLNIMHTGCACVNAAVKFEYPSAFSRRAPSRSEATSTQRKHEAEGRREEITRHAAAANDLKEHFHDMGNDTTRFVAFSRGQRAERTADDRIPRRAFRSNAIIARSRDNSSIPSNGVREKRRE